MDHKQFSLEIKSLGESGEFEGYAAIFGNLDLVGDVIEPGAFKEFHVNKAGAVKVLYQHDQAVPIGTATVSQDTKGLRVAGRLILADPQARVVHAHLKEGVLDALSIGYDVLPNGESFSELGFRRLTALKLWEISVVTFAANPRATITNVKSCGTVREFEKFLRSSGFSRRESKILAGAGFPGLIAADLADGEPDVSKLLEIAASIKI